MNRPRNRQPRPHQNNNNNRSNQSPRNPRSNRNNNLNVPTIQQVISGASVSIVQKADQPTGHEVQGIVKDVLTRGDHPRGIKVRLQDGRIGRVQRMATASLTAGNDRSPENSGPHSTTKIPRNQGSTLPLAGESNFAPDDEAPVVANCPICGNFEGDEAAVSYHVQQHLDGNIDPP